MIALIAISLGLLVIIASMLLLVKTQKEGLGKIFSFVSYASIAFGILIFACAVILSLGKAMCHAGVMRHHQCGYQMSMCGHGHSGCNGMGMMQGCKTGMGCKHGSKCHSTMKDGEMKCGKGGKMMKCKKIIRIETDDDDQNSIEEEDIDSLEE